MTRRAALFVILLVLGALGGVALLAIPGSPIHRETTLGLDLQGGLEVTLQAVPPKGKPLEKADLERSVEIMRSRVDKLGVAEPTITTQGDDQISIQLPGIKDPAAAAQIIGKTAKLELYDLEANATGPSFDTQSRSVVATASLFDLLAGQQSKVKDDSDAWYLFERKNTKTTLVVGPVGTREAALRKFDGEIPKNHRLFGVPSGTVVISCAAGEVCPGIGNQFGVAGQRAWYLFKFDPPNVPEMTGEDLSLRGTQQDYDPQTSQPIVSLDFTSKGGDKFADITRALVQRGRFLSNTLGGGTTDPDVFNQHFAIVLDREIRSWPQVDFTENPGGIVGGSAQISGNFTLKEAQDLALVLQTGALPVDFRTLDQTAVSATLGRDSLDEAKKAALIGLVVVAIFLLLIYRFLGVIAVFGLAIYAAFLYAAILLFNVTLTLPGFAGLVLTLGVAADANVVIFERIKEEVRAGRSIRSAISTGYTKGFHTIVDANVVTAITAFVLFALATASVRGFALMLLIGTGMSMLTAVLATRAFLSVLANWRVFENAAFVGAGGRGIPQWLKVDYIGKRRTWFALSGAILLLSVLAIGIRGLNLGIDFKGGTQVTFETTAPTALDRVRSVVTGLTSGNPQIQGRGTATGVSYREFQIRAETLDAAETQRLQRTLQEEFSAQAFGAKNVSASFGRQIAKGAILAIVISLLLIVAYIAARFHWKFSVPVLVALAHDVLITIGIYALVGREVSTATVAAVLTVLGYSIYDTIIIFDRIRENIPVMRRSSFRALANVSLWETIPRSLATTFITLLPIIALLAFGGDTLKDFAFALLVGIGSGAYSSIFVAAPLLAWFKEREPEYAKRKHDEGGSEASVGGLVHETGRRGPIEIEPVEVPVAAATPAPAPTAATPASAAAKARRQQRRSTRKHGR
ncbi:MAG: protein translocase subunit SecD [Gaiella sp.]